MAEQIIANETTEQPTPDVATETSNQQEPIVELEATVAPSETDLLNQKIEELQKQADSFKDQFLRKAAEFENFKRRTENDYSNLIRNANERLIIDLLPILNDFLRSLKAGAENKDYDAFYKGVELIHAKFAQILERQGLAPFDSVGKPFDVEYHDALLQMPKEGVAPHTVIEEIERGYKLNDKVLRHAKVIVSSATDVATPTTQEEVKA